MSDEGSAFGAAARPFKIGTETGDALGNTGRVISAVPTILHSMIVTASATGFVKLYDKATAPTSGDVPKYILRITGTAGASINFGKKGAHFANGIGVRAVDGEADANVTTTSIGGNAWVSGTIDDVNPLVVDNT